MTIRKGEGDDDVAAAAGEGAGQADGAEGGATDG